MITYDAAILGEPFSYKFSITMRFQTGLPAFATSVGADAAGHGGRVSLQRQPARRR